MDTKKYIDDLFASYEETPALDDFKEELRSNLDDRIQSLVKKGMEERTAFCKATAELGDVSALAEEISLKRKQEVFEEMFMRTRRYMTSGRVALFVAGGAVFCFGLIVTALTWFVTGGTVETLGSGLVFCVAGVAMLTFLGLTQETASRYPMSWKRALFYAADVGVFLFGAFCFPIVFFATRADTDLTAFAYDAAAVAGAFSEGWTAAVATLIPFVLPSAAVFVFLALTEKDRSKPWVIEFRKRAMARDAELLKNPAQFGMVCGAIWIAAIALFVVLTIRAGLLYSWVALVAALVLQLLVQAKFFTNPGK
jgi:MFS family permease